MKLINRNAILLLTIILSSTYMCSEVLAEKINPLLQNQANGIQAKLAKLELSSGGRIGIYAIDTANNRKIEYRGSERFAFCSTSKVIVV